MKKYIEREAAVDKLIPICKSASFRNRNVLSTARKCLEAIEAIPAADVVEVRHGRWIEDGNNQYCSECGEEHSWIDYRADYCDVCGAKMDGGVNDA